MHLRTKNNVSFPAQLPSLEGVSPPEDRTLLAHAHECSPSTRTEWRWSGWAEAHASRRWKWDEYRLAACRELPLLLECREGENPRLDYIQTDAIAKFLRDDNQGNPTTVKLVVSFTEGICAPYRPLLDSGILTNLTSWFNVRELEQHYPSHIVSFLSRKGSPNTIQTFACSTGYTVVYPVTVVTSYNPETDEVLGYIISDLGSFDHFALLGVSSQVECYQHPLLIQVLVLERSLECIMSDLEYLNNHTVVENVKLNRQYADRIVGYRVWWAGWQNRLSIIERTGNWILCQLNEIHEWTPQHRVQQYSAATERMKERLERVVRCCESAAVAGQTIDNRLSAWQDAAFRKAAQEDNRTMMLLAYLTRRDGSTMKLLAFLGTTFLPATFVSSFFSMTLFDWKAPTASDVMSKYFWVWWVVMIPLTLATFGFTMLWIKFRIGRKGKWLRTHCVMNKSN